MSRLEARGLGLCVAGRWLCERLDVRIEAGQCWGLLGRNGAGKTTLLHTLAGLRGSQAGSVLLDGRLLAGYSRRAIARQLGLLLQDAADAGSGTALETALMGRFPHVPFWGREAPHDRVLAEQALVALGLSEAAQRSVAGLSGGERQRVAVAALLAQDPGLYLLDEPTNHLDLFWQIRLLDLLKLRCAERGTAVLMALQDLNLAARYCDHLLLMWGDGRTFAGPVAAAIEHLDSLYGHPVRCLSLDGRRVLLPG